MAGPCFKNSEDKSKFKNVNSKSRLPFLQQRDFANGNVVFLLAGFPIITDSSW